jgi:hypothetical protein
MLEKGQIILRPISEQRKDWDKAFQKMHENGVTLDFSRPGKPTDNPYVESFNGKFRDECPSVNWILSFEDAPEKISSWKEDYNFSDLIVLWKIYLPKNLLSCTQRHLKTLFLTCPKNREDLNYPTNIVKLTFQVRGQ